MEEYRLQCRLKISKKLAIEKICAHAMYGNHGNIFRPKSKKEVYIYFKSKGINPFELAESCRNPKNKVPEFENLLGPTWEAMGVVSLVDNRNGEEVFKMKGPGKFIWSTYEAHFEAACASRDRAVKESSVAALNECLSQGFSSIEAFLNTQSRAWNKLHPEDKLIDSVTHKVSLETKIDDWAFKMSGGGKIIKTGKVWNDFKTLKKIRDELAIHPKQPGYGISLGDLAKHINAFRFGIALFLGNLHRLLNKPVPALIINAIYTPDVEVAQTSNKA